MKIGYAIACISLMVVLGSCASEPVEKEVIVVPATPVVVAPVVVKQPEAEKGTSIKLDGNKVEVKTGKLDIKVK